MVKADEFAGGITGAAAGTTGGLDAKRRRSRRMVVARRSRLLHEGGRWWSLGMLAGSVDESSDFWQPPEEEKWSREFIDAVEAGLFGVGRGARVLLLHPDATPGRLTAERARHLIETDRSYCFWHAWIEIDRAHDWLATWAERHLADWRTIPRVQKALRVAATAKIKPRSAAKAKANEPLTQTTAARPGVRLTKEATAEAQWDRMLAEMIARDEQPGTRAQVEAIAQKEFGTLLSKKAFGRVWDRRATLAMKKTGPRGPRHRPQG